MPPPTPEVTDAVLDPEPPAVPAPVLAVVPEPPEPVVPLDPEPPHAATRRPEVARRHEDVMRKRVLKSRMHRG
jgi:hypothetical protein